MYVYFLRQGRTGPIKMGVAGSPQQRLANLQVGNPTELHLIGQMSVAGGYEEARELEDRLQERFSLYRIRGEWFAVTKELLDAIASLSDEPAPTPPPLTEEERYEAMAARVRAAVDGTPRPRLEAVPTNREKDSSGG